MSEIVFIDKFGRLDREHADIRDELQIMAAASEDEADGRAHGIVALLGRMFGRDDVDRAA